jgi:diguanylate cyclase (GGDEF)-like protein/PAS domain S-box-containing protein
MKGLQTVPLFVWIITVISYVILFIFHELNITKPIFWFMFMIPMIVFGILVRSLMKNEYLYRTLTEEAQVGVYIYQNGTFLYVNTTMEKIFGYTKEEFSTLSPMELASPDDTIRISELIRKSIDTKRDVRFKALNKQKEILYVEMDGAWVTYHGRPALIGKVQDCTEQVKVEEELSLLNHQMIEVLEGMNDGFYTLDDEDRFNYVNSSAELLLRKSKSELLGKKVWDMFEGAKQLLAHKIYEVKKQKTFVEIEEFYEPLNLWFEARIDPSPDGGVSIFFRDITKRKNAESRISHMAYCDMLTGLFNRNKLHEFLSDVITNVNKGNRQQALLFIDLDGYKTINDTLGHQKGDLLLIQVAKRLSNCIEDGFVSRTGGDEFAVVISADKAVYTAEKIIQCVSQPYQFNENTEILLTSSIGIAVIDEGLSLDQLLVHADIAMYQAKANGKNGYIRFSYEHLVKLERKAWLEREIRKALDKDTFMLHYQPQLNIKHNRITGVEALIRWKHAEQGFISPDEFIPVVEETGQMNRLTEWVLRTACQQVIKWQQDQLDIRIAVNISTSSLNQNTLLNLVNLILNETGVSPEYIQLEITESIAALDPQFVVKQLTELKKSGLSIALDDFGTGYSSLSNLGMYPVDILKIDRSFIRGLQYSHISNAAAIIESIVALAHNLKMVVIAEGVETEEDLDFLRKVGCDEIQGYLFSHPLPAEEIGKVLFTSI